MKLSLLFGAVFGFLSVALGAFAAHGLKDKFDDYSMKVFQTGVQYQFYHAFALLVCGLLLQKQDLSLFRTSAFAFVFGIIIFSGSLYLLAFTQLKWLGAITPLGGVAFLIGWVLLGMGIWRIGG